MSKSITDPCLWTGAVCVAVPFKQTNNGDYKVDSKECSYTDEQKIEDIYI